jgi:hypothetical protein
MDSSTISLIALTLIFGASMIGMLIQFRLPEHHLSEDSKTIIKAARGVVVGLAALTLGLLIATAKGSFDTKESEMKSGSSKMIVLNRLLLNFGDQSKAAREALKVSALNGVKIIDITNKEGLNPKLLSGEGVDRLQQELLKLPEDTPTRKWLTEFIRNRVADLYRYSCLLVDSDFLQPRAHCAVQWRCHFSSADGSHIDDWGHSTNT